MTQMKTVREREEIARAKLYRAIGEFIFYFSQLEFNIKARLAGALKLEDELFDIVIGPYDFAMLCTVTRQTLSVGVDDATKKRIKKYFSECQTLNQTARLIVAHGTWSLEGGARHVSRSSLEAKYYFTTPEELDKQTKKARELFPKLFSLGAGR
jgi:hypothetical protein